MGYDQDMTEVRKALDSMGVNVEKARGGFPVGTTKQRRDGKTYKKQADGSWKPVTEGHDSSAPLNLSQSTAGHYEAKFKKPEDAGKPSFLQRPEHHVGAGPNGGKALVQQLASRGLFKPAQIAQRGVSAEARAADKKKYKERVAARGGKPASEEETKKYRDNANDWLDLKHDFVHGTNRVETRWKAEGKGSPWDKK